MIYRTSSAAAAIFWQRHRWPIGLWGCVHRIINCAQNKGEKKKREKENLRIAGQSSSSLARPHAAACTLLYLGFSMRECIAIYCLPSRKVLQRKRSLGNCSRKVRPRLVIMLGRMLESDGRHPSSPRTRKKKICRSKRYLRTHRPLTPHSFIYLFQSAYTVLYGPLRQKGVQSLISTWRNFFRGGQVVPDRTHTQPRVFAPA